MISLLCEGSSGGAGGLILNQVEGMKQFLQWTQLVGLISLWVSLRLELRGGNGLDQAVLK